ncbi:hypothetical protein BDP27DRAFT_1429106 [Rhodocollybia butyracea]|uniref:Uncharacterized protein n=1 Tax=Rhodocollybia butyracea TaxID=206335 RepID=A0A9P5U0D1_9AGAR|nr:hypothetical protein BDP27DRAFT_1429106 [Rhodocollybia butyracea]
MTPEEVAAVSRAGLAFFENLGVDILVSTLFGIYFLAYCISLYIYFKKKGNAGNAKKAMICVLHGNFALMVMLIVSFVAVTLEVVKYAQVISGGSMKQIAIADSKLSRIVENDISIWSGNVIELIADTVIVWRAWAVWMDNTKVKWTLLLLMLADTAVSLADCVAVSATDVLTESQSISLDWVAIILSLSVNIVATCLIGFRAWLHHKSMNTISIRRKKTQGERILLLLVESGAIYMLVQLLVIITNALNMNAPVASTIDLVTSFTSQLYISAACLNPVLIFILVQTQNTYDQSFHLKEIPTLSQQAQSQQVSVILNSLEGTPADVGLTEQENMIGST